LKIDSKYRPGLLIADHLPGFGRRFLEKKTSDINRNRLFIALKFYVEREFRIRLYETIREDSSQAASRLSGAILNQAKL